MLPACNTESNVGLWHDTSLAYLYSYDNWHLQQQATLVAGLWRTERRYGWKSYTNIHFDNQRTTKVQFVTCHENIQMGVNRALLFL